MAEVLLYQKELLVWLDETGCNNRSFMRKYGYATRGQVPSCKRLLVRGQRISGIAAIAMDGLVALAIQSTQNFFFDYIRGTLIPQMSPFDGTSPKSILVMDNCSIHHVDEVKEILQDAGIPIFFLPPYSPDYNPIEEAFSYVKTYLRKHDELLQSITNPCTIVRSALESITPYHCFKWITHSGYC